MEAELIASEKPRATPIITSRYLRSRGDQDMTKRSRATQGLRRYLFVAVCATEFLATEQVLPQLAMSVPSGAQAAILKESEPVPDNAIPVKGPNFDDEVGLQEFFRSYERIGFQATSFGRAIDIVDKMVSNSFEVDVYSVTEHL